MPLAVPRVVAGSPEADSAAGQSAAGHTAGWITPSFERGALLLADEDDQFFRLSWGELDGAPDRDRRRALPVGDYRLAGYRILRRTEGGAEWHVSATAHRIRDVRVEAGSEQRVEIDPAVRIGKRHRGKQVVMQIRGQDAGLSVYKDGHRIPIEYRLQNAAGDVVASGAMEYG